MSKRLFVLMLITILPIAVMIGVFKIAQSHFNDDGSQQEDDFKPGVENDYNFFNMSPRQHLKRAKQLSGSQATSEDLFKARHHLISIQEGSPEYDEGMKLLSTIERSLKTAGSK